MFRQNALKRIRVCGKCLAAFVDEEMGVCTHTHNMSGKLLHGLIHFVEETVFKKGVEWDYFVLVWARPFLVDLQVIR